MQRNTDRRTLKEAIALYGLSALAVLIAFIVAYQFVEPAPPRTIKMATGTPNNLYDYYGQQYQAALQKQGIAVDLLNTQGSVENLQLLQDKKVDIALVQSGMKTSANNNLQALGSLYYEPLWLFLSTDLDINQLNQLKGLTLAVGSVGSGTLAVSQMVLADNHITAANTQLVNLPSKEAVVALKTGNIDGLFMVTGPQNPLILELLQAQNIKAFSFNRAEAYNRLHPSLSAVTLPEGVLDLENNIPSTPIKLLAPTATLVVGEDFHPALTSLFLQAATEIHGHGGILESVNAFPSLQYVDFKLNEDAERFYRSGPPFLQRYMPFWAANLLDRLVVLLVPLITLMIPLMKILPPTYRWRIRSRIYRWYDQLRDIEFRAGTHTDKETAKALLDELLEIEKELMLTDIPKSYAESQYNLRLHIRLIRERLDWQLK